MLNDTDKRPAAVASDFAFDEFRKLNEAIKLRRALAHNNPNAVVSIKLTDNGFALVVTKGK